jgi:TatD DNase family protein
MIDTHCHLTFRDYAGQVDEVIARAGAAGVHTLITIATTSEDAPRALALATTHDNVYCTAGIHPLYADTAYDWDVIRAVVSHPRCVAWGELGLDNHHARPSRKVQDIVLEEQLGVIHEARAGGIDKPIVVHCREAFDDVLAVFRETSLDPTRFVFHCFTGTTDEAKRVLDFGAHISFTGVVTFANARNVAESARLVPADRILVETDSPFLTPEPNRTVRPNEPRYVVDVARFIAELRGVSYEEFEAQTDANARAFFGLDGPASG